MAKQGFSKPQTVGSVPTARSMKNYQFFENKECEYYPCHSDLEKINCIFCFCPLYNIDCGGNYTTTEKRIKDCSNCTFPHIAKNYKKVIDKLK